MTLRSVYFVNRNTGYIVGGDYTMQGIILKTTNGGTSWDIDSSSTYNYLTSVFFTDPDTGYAVGIMDDIKKQQTEKSVWIIELLPKRYEYLSEPG